MLVVAAAILALLLRPAGREGLAPVPAGLPATLELGMASAPGGAVAMRQTAPFAYRYQYLAGGPADGWTTWEPDGEFVTSYIRESRTSGMTPVFTYYVLQQSVSGDGSEQARVARGLADAGTMDAYLRGIELFFERAGQAGGTVILHVEPDLWGFGHQIANGDDAARVAVAMPAATGQPSNLAGLARAIVALRDRLAPGVLLAYSLSNWGTGHDFTYGHFTDAEGVLREALDMAGPSGSDRARVLGALAQVSAIRDRNDEAHRYLLEALELAFASGAHELLHSLEDLKKSIAI